jgi:hypothetical protein
LLKPVLFALLVADTAYYVYSGSTSKAVDSVAWLVLLALYVAEIRFVSLTRPSYRHTLRAARLAAAAGVIAATIGYVFEDNALDAANSVLWILVVILLEIEFRFPRAVERARSAFAGAAVALYGGLGVIVLLWALRGQWMDAYDAVLWLTAFVVIELAAVARGAPDSPLTSH